MNTSVLKKLVSRTSQEDLYSYKVSFYRLQNANDRSKLQDLVTNNGNIQVLDEIECQLTELIKALNPTEKLDQKQSEDLIASHLNGVSREDYGVWVYYSWSNTLVHILDEQEFIFVRTVRNRYKITAEEQNTLSQKKIGIIGLSVGQSSALTMAQERVAGEFKLADFDRLELTNLNRLRSGIQNIGTHKTVLVAREIAEIDPFIKVTCYNEGITEQNIEAFLLDNGKLDFLIEECDSIDIKILSRIKAKENAIPVIMEGSDRGTIDIERFDLEPDRPILHGWIEHLDYKKLGGEMTNEEKLPYIYAIAGMETLSKRLKDSMKEIGISITGWPQLSSAVALGGALSTDTLRRCLLKEYNASGRYFIDFDKIITEKDCDKYTRVPATHR